VEWWLRFVGGRLMAAGNRVVCDAGVVLQDLIDFAIERGLKGLETLAGIPGWVGAAVYGNAGAYGHCDLRAGAQQCGSSTTARCACSLTRSGEFRYRESIFKEHREWIIFSTELLLEPAGQGDLRRTADDILKIRNEKFPPAMKCAGSIFKNFLLAELPAEVGAQVPAVGGSRREGSGGVLSGAGWRQGDGAGRYPCGGLSR